MIFVNRLPPLILTISVVLIAGCTKMGEFPSLAKRPFETASPQSEPAPPLPSAENPALSKRISQIVAQARAGQLAFNQEYEAAQKAVGGGNSAPGSENWVAAQLAVSRLEPLRSPAQSALVAIDDEQRQRLISGVDDDQARRLDIARAEVEAITTDQMDRVNRLQSQIRRR